MKCSSLSNGCLYEVNFGYNSDLEGYTTLMSDIPKLYAISRLNMNSNFIKMSLTIFKY